MSIGTNETVKLSLTDRVFESTKNNWYIFRLSRIYVKEAFLAMTLNEGIETRYELKVQKNKTLSKFNSKFKNNSLQMTMPMYFSGLFGHLSRPLYYVGLTLLTQD
ncbi:MAG: hypothetical protein AABW45_03000 [Nanoarchaeota archaeon]